MSVKVGINGFGRIGRQVLRISLDRSDIEVVAINDIADLKTCFQLLKYDSVFGQLNREVDILDDGLQVDGKNIKFFSKMSPSEIDWTSMNCDIVIESTGIFTTKEKASMHIGGSVKKVVISAPASGQIDLTTVMGANDELYDPLTHNVVSNASCTTNCLAMIVKVLRDNFGLKNGHMTTVHSYTNDQKIVDSPHKDIRRARAGALSMIPTSTGATKAIEEIFPELKGNLSAISVRVPTPNVSMVDFVANIEKKTTLDEINNAFDKASSSYLNGYLGIAHDGAVSMDLLGNSNSAIYDPFGTSVISDSFIKIVAWYDNEYGYSSRVIDLTVKIGSMLWIKKK